MVPQHIAIIMDGNRRFAKNRGIPVKEGHRLGGEQLEIITDAAVDLGVKTLTVYGFSTENWRRPALEVKVLMNLVENFLKSKRASMVERGVCFNVIGDLSKLNKNLLSEIALTQEATKGCNRINLVVGLNYGARDEIVRAAKKMAEKIPAKDFCEEALSASLDTAPWGDPDLLIRPGGEMRLSNFLLWQMSYAEIYVTDRLWPEFGVDELKKAVHAYSLRDRRGGE
ncbi:MAG: polyprenyl diphosphate synthase [Candidatus Algichlamydia australiensis]|nr:polyprenyl diphosphate synthase [Chlamydiales bacterium]